MGREGCWKVLTADVLVIGAGITGLSIARELKARYPDLSITVIEKEGSLARHASGRNSGVLHAGFYYTPESLKARYTAEGNRLLTEYCVENNLSLNRCGKVVVAKDENDLKTLFELKKRGERNGIDLEMIDEGQLKEIEPNARTFEKAIYSPTTSTVDPEEVVNHIGDELMNRDVRIVFNEGFIKREGEDFVITTRERINFGHLINSAGLYADKIAHQFGVGERYTLIPFKGCYLEYRDNDLINRHVYPVPDLKNPFLGVHFTKTVNGGVKLGPTSMPVFWRENYSGLANFRWREFLEIISWETLLFISNKNNFRSLAIREIRKYRRVYFIKQAMDLIRRVDVDSFGRWLRPGIRAQLVDREKKCLVTDFVVEHGEKSTHILNAVSPAFTSAFAFSRFIVDTIQWRSS